MFCCRRRAGPTDGGRGPAPIGGIVGVEGTGPPRETLTAALQTQGPNSYSSALKA